jgi:hypothetical protein
MLDDAARRFLSAVPEIDYLAHIVFRLYENVSVPVQDPLRHRVEVLFSPGAALCPFDGTPREPFTGAVQGAFSGGGIAPQTTVDAHRMTSWSGALSHPAAVVCLDPVVLVPSLPLSVFEAMIVAAIQGSGGDLSKA